VPIYDRILGWYSPNARKSIWSGPVSLVCLFHSRDLSKYLITVIYSFSDLRPSLDNQCIWGEGGYLPKERVRELSAYALPVHAKRIRQRCCYRGPQIFCVYYCLVVCLTINTYRWWRFCWRIMEWLWVVSSRTCTLPLVRWVKYSLDDKADGSLQALTASTRVAYLRL
jgi:hypothetical protein